MQKLPFAVSSRVAHWCAVASLSLPALVFAAIDAQAQGQSQQGGQGYNVSARRVSDDGSSGSYRSFMVGLPIVTTDRGMTGRLELNLYGKASLALEGNVEPKSEDMVKSESKTSGESLMTQGKSGVLMLNRYSRPYTLSGFYYGFGLGYRQEETTWHERTSSAGVSLADSTYANHDVMLQGPTGHARLGYRYVGTEYPFLIGAYGGARHFQATATDRTNPTNQPGAAPVTPTTDAEKEHLKRRFETAPELGLEVGFMF